MNDERVREIVLDAYRPVQLRVPLTEIEHPVRRSSRRTPVLVAVAAAVLAVTAGMSLVAGQGGPSTVAADGEDSTVSPPVSATAPVSMEDCDVSAVRIDDGPVPRRITLSSPPIELYADATRVIVCWGGPTVMIRDTTRAPELFPAGELSAWPVTMARGDDSVGLTFGRTPPGTTKVEVHFADGTTAAAKMEGEWYAAAVPGPSNDVVRVVAQTPSGPVTHEVPQPA